MDRLMQMKVMLFDNSWLSGFTAVVKLNDMVIIEMDKC